jgi:hypothetical protein
VSPQKTRSLRYSRYVTHLDNDDATDTDRCLRHVCPATPISSNLLQWLSRLIEVPDAEKWVQPVSFVLVSTLMFSSLRGFLLSTGQIFRSWKSSHVMAMNSAVLVVTQILGTYVVAAILLTRMSMPESFRYAACNCRYRYRCVAMVDGGRNMNCPSFVVRSAGMALLKRLGTSNSTFFTCGLMLFLCSQSLAELFWLRYVSKHLATIV